MLLFGDLHINSRICGRVLDEIKTWISENPNEKNLIFLWDYVYHFSYDREALLALYTLFLDLYSQWKNVYILSWNHDWLWNTFVFEEAKRTYEIIKKINNSDSTWKIEFITQPKLEEIEWNNILFLPFFIGIQSVDDVNFDTSNPKILEIQNTIKSLCVSKNKNEKISASINNILLKYYMENKNLIVFHHYYTEWINFPGQKWRFYFNDISLSHLFCELDGLKLISGHLHQWFAYKNYFCVWSVRNTSPLEINQIKVLFKYSNGEINWKKIYINPYFQLDDCDINNKIDEKFLSDFENKIIELNENNYKDLNINFDSWRQIKNKDVSLSLKVDNINYDEMYSYVDENLFKNLKDVKLKKNFAQAEDVFEKMDIEWKNLSTWFSDWKWLLKDYLKKKYSEDYDNYIEFLKNENIL